MDDQIRRSSCCKGCCASSPSKQGTNNLKDIASLSSISATENLGAGSKHSPTSGEDAQIPIVSKDMARSKIPKPTIEHCADHNTTKAHEHKRIEDNLASGSGLKGTTSRQKLGMDDRSGNCKQADSCWTTMASVGSCCKGSSSHEDSTGQTAIQPPTANEIQDPDHIHHIHNDVHNMHDHHHDHGHHHEHAHDGDGCENSGDCCTPTTCRSSTCTEKCRFMPSDSLCGLDQIDLEKGTDTSPQAVRTVVFGVLGMTCTGCESNLIKALRSHSGVKQVTTSFVLCRAEVSYDALVIPDPALLAARVKKLTGFKCTVLKLSAGAGTVYGEVFQLRGLTAEGQVALERVNGVESVTSIGMDVYEVLYDPEQIGIRTLLDRRELAGITFVSGVSEARLSEQKAMTKHGRTLCIRTLVAIMFTIPVLVFAWADLKRPSEKAKWVISLCLSTVVQLVALPIYKGAYKAVIHRKEVDMDVLVVLSITSAFIYSLAAFGLGLREGRADSRLGQPLFETSTALIMLILIGRLLTLRVRNKARDSIKMDTLQAKAARLVGTMAIDEKPRTVGKHPNQIVECSERTIDIDLLQYGDILEVRAGEKIATDGIIVSGEVEVDDALVTGESLPSLRCRNSHVLAGSNVVTGTARYRVTRLVNENTISVVKRLVDTAASSKTKTQEITDKVASYITPLVFAFACLAFFIWVLVNIFVRHVSRTGACVNALTYAIAILAISCPCALAIAVPLVVVVAYSVAVKHGLLFKNALALEVGGKIRHAVFDKTGTLTSGQLEVQDEHLLVVESGFNEAEIRNLVLAVIEGSQHPVSASVRRYLTAIASTEASQSSLSFIATGAKEVVGKGVELNMDGHIIRAGKPGWLGIDSHPIVREALEKSLSLLCVTRNSTLVAIYALSSTVRTEAAEVLQILRSKGIDIHILSGDHTATVTKVATQFAVPLEMVRSGCDPEAKAVYIEELRSLMPGKILFIGDGTNDAPALQQADVGVCMSNSTDIAASVASVVILSDNLHGLLEYLKLAKRATRRVWLSISWALLYNIVAIMLAGGVFEPVGFRVEPSFAGVGEVVSLLPVFLLSFSLSVSFSLREWRWR